MDLDTVLKRRADRDLFFAEHYSSPLPEEHQPRFDGLDYFDPDPGWEIMAAWEPSDSTKVPVPSTAGHESLYTKLGVAVVTIGNTIYELTVLDDGDGGSFIPFRDGTCGQETYGGGRYVGLTVSADGTTTIDFNAAQNPWCVYDEEFTCPLPPEGNLIAEPIRAGEKMYPHPDQSGAC